MKALLWDHPRVCGEKGIARDVVTQREGSPPRVRGKEIITGDDAYITRITPACAGKSAARRRIPSIYWDHPRVCGEKQRARIVQQGLGGSPPRVRGKG